MKKVILSAAALLLASTFSFAGTPETKENAKPEVKTEIKAVSETNTLTATYTYHVTSENGDGTVNFTSGPGPNCSGSSKLCEWQSSAPMVSPQDPDDIESSPNILPNTTKRRN